MSGPVRIGLVGCGTVSSVYLRVLRQFDLVQVVACADLDESRARARAAEFGIPRPTTVADLLADPEVEVVLNLTVPTAHAEVSLAALAAGKHVYSEKPLATSLEDGRRLVETAQARGLRLGVAPDTFLGAGLQTGRKLIDDGWIGAPVAATAFLMTHGPESWHPSPEFYYQPGGGPLFDMGPYYLTALVGLLGPVRRVTGSARITFPERTIASEPRRGQIVPVEVPTHVAGVLDFSAGPIATIVTSFDVWGARLPHLEVYGTAGSLSLPDPNTFGGPVLVRRAGAPDWQELPLTHGFPENSRGIGLVDLAHALRRGRPHRASADLAFHVLEIMHGLQLASAAGRHYALTSVCARPDPLPAIDPTAALAA